MARLERADRASAADTEKLADTEKSLADKVGLKVTPEAPGYENAARRPVLGLEKLRERGRMSVRSPASGRG